MSRRQTEALRRLIETIKAREGVPSEQPGDDTDELMQPTRRTDGLANRHPE